MPGHLLALDLAVCSQNVSATRTHAPAATRSSPDGRRNPSRYRGSHQAPPSAPPRIRSGLAHDRRACTCLAPPLASRRIAGRRPPRPHRPSSPPPCSAARRPSARPRRPLLPVGAGGGAPGGGGGRVHGLFTRSSLWSRRRQFGPDEMCDEAPPSSARIEDALLFWSFSERGRLRCAD